MMMAMKKILHCAVTLISHQQKKLKLNFQLLIAETYTLKDYRSQEYNMNFYQVIEGVESSNAAGWDITQQFGETDIFYYDLSADRKWYISKVVTTTNNYFAFPPNQRPRSYSHQKLLYLLL